MKAFTKLKDKALAYFNSLGILKYIIWFFLLFILFDFFWKAAVKSGDHGSLWVFGQDLSAIVYPISKWTADATYWTVHDWWGYKDFIQNDTFVHFPNSIRLIVVWDCTGVKQILMFSFIIALIHGPWRHKLWYIPASALFLNLINVLRIALTALLVKDGYPDWFIPFNEWFNKTSWDGTRACEMQFQEDWFQLFHYHVFKWLYYDGVMFLLWLLWNEKFNLPFQKKKQVS